MTDLITFLNISQPSKFPSLDSNRLKNKTHIDTLWKKRRLKELTQSEVGKITDLIISFALKVEPSRALFPLAIDIAIACDVTVYDALYLSMAKVYETQVMTADRKLFDLTAETDLKRSVIWLGNYGEYYPAALSSCPWETSDKEAM